MQFGCLLHSAPPAAPCCWVGSRHSQRDLCKALLARCLQATRPPPGGGEQGWLEPFHQPLCWTPLRFWGAVEPRLASPVPPCCSAPEASSWPRSPEALSGCISAGQDAEEGPGVPTSKGFGSRASVGRSGLAIRLR